MSCFQPASVPSASAEPLRCRAEHLNRTLIGLNWVGLACAGRASKQTGRPASGPGNLGSRETAEAGTEPIRAAIKVKVKIHIDDLAREGREDEEGWKKK
jgi:hypothetical protein